MKLDKRDLKRAELLVDFLIKFNLLAIPMYVAIFLNVEFYPLQLMLTDLVYSILTMLGYEVVKDGIMLTFVSPAAVATVVMGVDCTAWKSMYALAALMLASPVANNLKKWKHILLGVLAVFALNIVRVVSTIVAGYYFGMDSLEIVHTLLWREGLIFAVIAIWLFWLKKQKVIFREKQTILSKLQL